MSDAARADETWTPWRVVPDSGFEVDDPTGSVGIVQIDHKRFLVLHRFRFSNPEIEAYLTRKLVERGMAEPEALVTVDDARTFTPSEDNPTDLASIPRYMRWFENPYGKHSLAALIHDELITKEVNGGRLGSDTLADRFFREMMKTSGVPWLKRWIMWAAVAARSRLVAGGLRTASMIAWIGLCVVGLMCVIAAFGSWIFGWSVPIDPWWLLVIATALPIVAARLWGEQWGASIVFAVAAFWIVPAGAVAGLGYLVYLSLEHLAVRAGYE